jgi:hypothetical protein
VVGLAGNASPVCYFALQGLNEDMEPSRYISTGTMPLWYIYFEKWYYTYCYQQFHSYHHVTQQL